MKSHQQLPPFGALPLELDGPEGNAWGLFGPYDQLGMLNLLTPETVAAAAQEIRTGVRISLDWTLDKPSHPSFNRAPFQHSIKHKAPRYVNDDTLTFNTQSSSQWDGFRHYGYQDAGRFFNGRTQQDIESSSVIGIDAWVNSGGIIGRGVLLDYAGWAAKNSIAIQHFESTSIPLDHLQRLVKEKNITFHSGDILLIRSGYTAAYERLSADEQAAIPQRPSADFVGVESSKEVLQWIWENHFAAVAGDMVAFEITPLDGPHSQMDGMLHQWLLAGWGMPIGELFDLGRLAQQCEKLGRWSFFFTSVPLKVPGGVASPPNAVAIF